MNLNVVREYFMKQQPTQRWPVDAQSSVFFPEVILSETALLGKRGGVNIVRILGLICRVHMHARVDPYNSKLDKLG